MSKTRVLFVDRDGTLIEEPPDEQVDSIEKILLVPELSVLSSRSTNLIRLVMSNLKPTRLP